MERTLRDDDGRMYGASSIVERRKLNWSAIVAGVAATLGLEVLLMYFGAAIGVTLIDPFAPLGSAAVTAWTIVYLAGTAIIAGFFGAWVAGHWGNLYETEDAVMHGIVTWALAAVLIAAGLGSMIQMTIATATSSPQVATELNIPGSPMLSYNALQDKEFTSHVLDRAQAYAQANPPPQQPLNVTADQDNNSDQAKSDGQSSRKNNSNEQSSAKEQKVQKSDLPGVVSPEDIAGDDGLKAFVSDNTTLNEEQAGSFLQSEKKGLAQAEQKSVAKWKRSHATELAQYSRAKDSALTAAWTWAGLALVSLLSAMLGSYVGWRQRYTGEEAEPVEPGPTGGTGTI